MRLTEFYWDANSVRDDSAVVVRKDFSKKVWSGLGRVDFRVIHIRRLTFGLAGF